MLHIAMHITYHLDNPTIMYYNKYCVKFWRFCTSFHIQVEATKYSIWLDYKNVEFYTSVCMYCVYMGLCVSVNVRFVLV